MSKIKVTLISRIRNESLLLNDFINSLDEYIDSAYWFDDCSVDNSVEILENYPKTKAILRNFNWTPAQGYTQTAQRNLLFNYAKTYSANDIFLLAEPDERIFFDFDKLEEYDKQGIVGVYFRLFDAYLTPDNKDSYLQGRVEKLGRLFGKEMREICFLFNKNYVNYNLLMQGGRQPTINGKTIVDGFVQHYSKAISEDKYEADCRYYIESMPMFKEKFEKRIGKAIKENYQSDFGTDLMRWEELISNENNWIKI